MHNKVDAILACKVQRNRLYGKPLQTLVPGGITIIESLLEYLQSISGIRKIILASNLYYAMYSHTQNHVNIYLNAATESFKKIMHCYKNGTLSQKLKEKPSNSGFKRLN